MCILCRLLDRLTGPTTPPGAPAPLSTFVIRPKLPGGLVVSTIIRLWEPEAGRQCTRCHASACNLMSSAAGPSVCSMSVVGVVDPDDARDFATVRTPDGRLVGGTGGGRKARDEPDN